MTHDELVTTVKANGLGERITQGKVSPNTRALLAVLEIHKPFTAPGGTVTCERCTDWDGGYAEYPCPTVQAIEREVMR